MRTHTPTLIPGFLLLLLAACPTDKDIADESTGATEPADTTAPTGTVTAATDPTGGPAATCPDHAQVDACCCFAALPADEPRYVDTVCPAAPLCDTVEYECDDLDLICATTTASAVECALTTLGAGTGVGLVEVHYNIGSGYGDTRFSIHMQGDGTAYIVHREVLDVSDVHRPTGRFDLKPRAYFDACLATTTDDEKARCLMEVFDGELTEQCIDELYAEAL